MNARPSMSAREVLLSAVAVVVLSAALWPAVRQIRERSEAEDACRSNLKQIGLALLQYSQDFDELLPADYEHAKPGYYWHSTLQPYLRSMEVIECPLREGDRQFSYGYNSVYLNHRRLADIEAPAFTAGFCDAGRDDTGEMVARCYHVDPPAQPTFNAIVRPDFRHDGSMTAFVDGHVKLEPDGDFYPRTASEGGDWKGDAKNPPNLKKPPAADRWWSGNGK